MFASRLAFNPRSKATNIGFFSFEELFSSIQLIQSIIYFGFFIEPVCQFIIIISRQASPCPVSARCRRCIHPAFHSKSKKILHLHNCSIGNTCPGTTHHTNMITFFFCKTEVTNSIVLEFFRSGFKPAKNGIIIVCSCVYNAIIWITVWKVKLLL